MRIMTATLMTLLCGHISAIGSEYTLQDNSSVSCTSSATMNCGSCVKYESLTYASDKKIRVEVRCTECPSPQVPYSYRYIEVLKTDLNNPVAGGVINRVDDLCRYESLPVDEKSFLHIYNYLQTEVMPCKDTDVIKCGKCKEIRNTQYVNDLSPLYNRSFIRCTKCEAGDPKDDNLVVFQYGGNLSNYTAGFNGDLTCSSRLCRATLSIVILLMATMANM